jgi:tripartite-type tricarboxylate transporter receptor subunit TctC
MIAPVKAALLLSLWFLAAEAAGAQGYPNKPIRIVTSEVGGAADFGGRLLARGLSASFGQPVIVDNRPSGPIPAEIVWKSRADGYTVLLAGNTFWIGPLLRKTSFDPMSDFAAISMVSRQPSVLVVGSAVGIKSVADLIGLAKANPGKYNYGSTGLGSSSHIAGELFKTMAGINIVNVAYKGTPQALVDLIGGQLQLMFPNAGSALPQIKSGKLTALAVTSARPSPVFPELPTVSASGLPGYEAALLQGVFAPSGIAMSIVKRLNEEIGRVLNQAETKEAFFNTNVEAVSSTPQDLTQTVRSEIKRLSNIIRVSDIKVQ